MRLTQLTPNLITANIVLWEYLYSYGIFFYQKEDRIMGFLAGKTAVITGGGKAVLSIRRRIFLSYGKLSNQTPLSFESGVFVCRKVKNILI